jgi:hypothetical protein
MLQTPAREDNRGRPNNEMQRPKHGQDGASPLISVFDGPIWNELDLIG